MGPTRQRSGRRSRAKWAPPREKSPREGEAGRKIEIHAQSHPPLSSHRHRGAWGCRAAPGPGYRERVNHFCLLLGRGGGHGLGGWRAGHTAGPPRLTRTAPAEWYLAGLRRHRSAQPPRFPPLRPWSTERVCTAPFVLESGE